MLRPLNTVPQVVVTPSQKILLLLHNCDVAVMNGKHLCFLIVLRDPVKGSFDPKGVMTHRLRTVDLDEAWHVGACL